jgi:hypothetical protein
MRYSAKIKNNQNQVVQEEIFEYSNDAQEWATATVAGKNLSFDVGEYQKPQAEINKEARDYLASTDWHIIKHTETGYQVPQDIVNERAAARLRIVD